MARLGHWVAIGADRILIFAPSLDLAPSRVEGRHDCNPSAFGEFKEKIDG